MKIVKFVLIVLWVLATTLFIVGALTPLEFRSKIVAYASFLISLNGAFALKYLLSDYAKLKINTIVIVALASIALAATYYFSPVTKEDWKTQEILYRKKDNYDNVIVFQMIQNGNMQFDHRMVKLTRVTPFFDWVVELNNFKAGEEWVKVNEYVNQLDVPDSNIK